MKSLSLKVVLIIGLIAASVLAIFQLPSCKDAKQMAKENRCPYEGFECPNAQQALAQDGDVIDSLETELSACQLKDHSQIPDSGAHLDIKRDSNHNNAITSIVYTDTDGKQYRLRK